MTYKQKIKITQEELNYYNSLLSLELDECSPYYNKHDIERLGGKTDDYIGVRTVEFENGNYITIDLASGGSNYYDDIVLYDKDNRELVVSDCTYELSSFNLFYQDNIYEVEFVVC